jgi:hypothetical protein
MGDTRQRIVLGLGAAVAAFGAAAMISAATAPAAHADDFSTILADVTATEAAATTAFATASTDLAAGNTAAGLTQLFIGLDDDLLGVPNEFQVGFVDLLQGVPVIPASDFEFSFATPATFAASVTEANTFYQAGVALATTILGLPATDYADTALDNALSTIDQLILPDQIQLIGDLAYMF